MKVDVRFHGLQQSQALREHATRRIHSQLSRFAHAIRMVRLRLSDVNGPRGGRDKRCQVTVRGPSFEDIHLEQLSDDAYTAVDSAAKRVAVVLGEQIRRARTQRARRNRLVPSWVS